VKQNRVISVSVSAEMNHLAGKWNAQGLLKAQVEESHDDATSARLTAGAIVRVRCWVTDPRGASATVSTDLVVRFAVKG
jgi:hypothetical protein